MPRSSKSILVISCCPLLCCFDAVQMIDACLTGHVFDSFNWMVQKNLKEHNLRILPVVWRWRLRPRWSANRRQPPGVQRLRERDTRQCGCGQLTSAVLSCCVMLSTVVCCLNWRVTCHGNFLSSVDPHVAPQPNHPCPRDILGLLMIFPVIFVGFGVQSCKWQLAARWQDGKGCTWHSSDIQLEFQKMQFSNPSDLRLIDFLIFPFVVSLCFFFTCQAGSSSAISKSCRCSRRLEDEALWPATPIPKGWPVMTRPRQIGLADRGKCRSRETHRGTASTASRVCRLVSYTYFISFYDHSVPFCTILYPLTLSDILLSLSLGWNSVEWF